MGIAATILMGCALAMDACAAGMTNGMHDSKMPFKKVCVIALFFGFFQFVMPLIGYFITGVVTDLFMETFQKISSWVSFAVLAFLGGKMIVECVSGWVKNKGEKAPEVCTTDGACTSLTPERENKPLTIGELILQAIATSIDALAVGVTLQMAAVSEMGLTLGVWGSTLTIGGITFLMSVGAIYIGKFVGDKLAEKASLIGGIALVLIGLKLLLDGIL